MGQVVQTNGSYEIRTGEGNQILLNTGYNVGTVRVTGNLLVEGDTLTVSAENLDVADNIIRLNVGETGDGVTLEYAGIEIDRGEASEGNALFVLDDRQPRVPVWTIGNGSVVGSINFDQSNLKVRRIFTDSGTDGGDLTLIGDSSALGVVKVLGTVNYEQQVTDDDDIPNKKYVDDAIQSNPTFQIVRDAGNTGTRVVAFDKDDPLDTFLYFPPAVGPYVTQPTDGITGNPLSLVSVVVDNQIAAEFYEDHAIIQGLDIIGTEIVNDDTNTNIFIRTNGTGRLQTNYALQIDHSGVVPTSVGDATVIHSGIPGLGNSGVYFVNSNDTNDELISRNKALLYSMIF